VDRRTLLRALVVGGPTVALSGGLWGSAAAAPAQTGSSPYGALRAADANGIQLPSGFTSRIIARSRQTVVPTGYRWHDAPDGGACFADPSRSGSWVYVSNSEISSTGGASAIRFNSSGSITAAYRVLSNTNRNCAGGAMPWGTWLSCEEVSRGYVYETFPHGGQAARRRSAMGRFNHEAAAADPERGVVYLTEDEPNGCFYRFRPTTWGTVDSLASGTLEVLVAPASLTSGPVEWRQVPDVDGSPTLTRDQVSGAKRFNGGEGCYYANDKCWFTTKGDNRVWVYDAATPALDVAYDDLTPSHPLTGVDNITGSTGGDLYVAEDGGNMEINIIAQPTPPATVATVAPFLRVIGQGGSEICGPAFSPDGKRLYFSSQRGTSGSSSGGITYEVQGPFRT
jgi:secreted PhoX family phosphatase